MEPKVAFQLILFLKSNNIRTTIKDLEIAQQNWIVNMKIQQQTDKFHINLQWKSVEIFI